MAFRRFTLPYVSLVRVILSCQSGFAQTPIDKTTVEYQIELKNRTFNADAQIETGMNILAIKLASKSDYLRGAEWLENAAFQDYVEAQYELGRLYYLGTLIPADLKLSAKWMFAAAKKGHIFAQSILGEWYGRGYYFKQNNAQSIYWYRKSAEQGYYFSQRVMGMFHESGTGMPVNKARAIYWFKLAAAQGDTIAKEGLQKLTSQQSKKTDITPE